MQKVKVIRLPRWQQSIEKELFNIITDVGEIFQTKKNLIIALLICYSLIFLATGFSWAVIDYKRVGKN